MAKKTHISKTDETKNESGIRIQSSSPSSVVSNSFTIDSTNNDFYFENKVLKPQLSPVVLTGTAIDITNSNYFTANINQDTTFSFTGNEDGRTVTVFLKNVSDLIFQGRITGMTTDVTIKTTYSRMLEVHLFADGVKTINQIISAYNSSTLLSPVTLVSGDGTQIPTAGFFKLSQKNFNVNFSGVSEIFNDDIVLKSNTQKIYVFKFINSLIYGELKINLNKYIRISSGPSRFLTLKNDGRVFSCGANTSGQLGDNTAVNKSSPVQVVGQSDFVAISAKLGNHSLALKADGRIFSWGYNNIGQLGDNTVVSKSSPVQVVGQSDFVAISAGDSHSLALKADGRVFSWGLNANGQLGDNTIANKSSPILVVNQSSFVAISSGQYHSLALKGDGRVFSWGSNSAGQLGDNTIVAKSVPTLVINQSDFVAIAAGAAHSVALKANGTVWTWGSNGNGQLGDNTILGKQVPTLVVNESNFVAIASGANHCLALKADGRVFIWGANASGQIGDGTVLDKSIPTLLVAQSDFVAISAGDVNSLALKSDGRIFSWGGNIYGQVGDNTTVAKSSPVQVIKL